MAGDGFFWYNVGEWADYGLAVPNWGKETNRKSQNNAIRDYVYNVGRNLCAIMWHTDTRLRTPPSINTITRVHKLCNRGRNLLAANAVRPSTPYIEPAHAQPIPEEHLLFPTPYFKMRNPWMKRWCEWGLLSITEAIQAQENARPLQFSEQFAGLVGQYIRLIYRDMAITLLGIPAADADKPDFMITEAQLQAYNPGKEFTSTEMIDSMPDVTRIRTEDELQYLTDGIPISYLPKMGPFPDASASPVVSGATTAAASFVNAPSI